MKRFSIFFLLPFLTWAQSVGNQPQQSVRLIASPTASQAAISLNLACDASIANLGTQYSVGGLVNVLAYSCGIPINDGKIHTVGSAPSGTCFSGIASLSGLAAININGVQPFAWITATNNNIFTSTSGAYKLTDSSVPKLDIAWLSIQTSLIGGKTYIPSGNYVVGSALPLPLYIPLTNTNSMYLGAVQPDIIRGDGEFATNIVAGSDFGSKLPLLVCGDPAGTATNQLGRYVPNSDCQGLATNFSLWSNQNNAIFPIGAAPVAMDGFAWGAQLVVENVASNGFYNDWTIVGDHTRLTGATAQGGTRGFYWAAPNAVRTGDLTFIDLTVLGVSQAGLVVNGNASITASFKGETYVSAPYPILGESGGCSDILYSSEFDRLMTEYTGNAFIADDNGFSNGVYDDSKKCRGIHMTTIGNWFPNYVNGSFWGANGRGRRASIDVGQVGSFVIEKLNPAGGSFVPTPAPSGPAPITTINATNLGDWGLGASKIVGQINMWIWQSGSLPLARCAGGPCYDPQFIAIEQPGEYSGFLAHWYVNSGNYTTTTAGDVFEHSQYSYSPGGQGYGAAPDNVLSAGVVLQSGLTPAVGFVPLQTTGSANVNFGFGGWTWGAVKKASGIGRTVKISAAGSGGANGTFNWTATGGGCSTAPTGTFTVAGGAITATSITNHGSGCTGIPSIPTSLSSGLNGAQLTPIWPGALGTAASSLTGPLLGMSHGGNTPGNGNNVFFVRLQGLQ